MRPPLRRDWEATRAWRVRGRGLEPEPECRINAAYAMGGETRGYLQLACTAKPMLGPAKSAGGQSLTMRMQGHFVTRVAINTSDPLP